MKVVLFCGGQGLRLREFGGDVPKPMVPLGYRPVLWHVMRWYAHHGHTDFVLCLGHGADAVKRYFLDYDETTTNDFVLRPTPRNGRRADDERPRNRARLVTDDIGDWSITFVDTGINANIGERLSAVRPYLGDDEFFLANYADGLTDAPLPRMIDDLRRKHRRDGTAATFLRVRPSQSFHCMEADDDGTITAIKEVQRCDVWINGGYFVLHRDVFDVLGPGEELVGPAFDRLVARRRLTSWRHDGFFAAMDTFKEQQHLARLHAEGLAPWQVWNPAKSAQRDAAAVRLVAADAKARAVA